MENEGEDMQQMSEMSDSRKRPYSDGTEHHFAKKRPNPGAGDGSILLKQLIPSVIAGVIIGKGGESITKLQANTETVVKMSKSGDFYPGTTDRVCVITGFPDNVRNAHNIIWEHIREKCDKSNEEFKVRLVVPNLTVGMIIGKSGCYVKQIKEETGANVQISQKAQDSSLVERVVTVNGAIDQASAAFDMVFKMIISDPQSGSCPNVSYSDFRGPVPNASPMGSPYANSMMDMTTKSMMNHLAIDALKATLRGSGYSIQACDEIAAALCTLMGHGLLGSAGLGGIGAVGASVGGLSLEYLASILGGGNRNNGGGVRDNNGIFGSYGNSFNSGNESFGASNNNSFGLGLGSDGQGDVTKELQVNENVVGAIIGPGGRAIVEIQKVTSANVQISKKGVFAPGTHNRVVTISGQASAVERAMYMVQQCIHQEENKRTRQEQMQIKF